MKKVFKIERMLLNVEIFLSGLFILSAWFITLYSIVMRNLGYSTGDWTLGLPVTLITWSIFIGSGYNLALNKHINTDFFLKVFFPEKLQKAVIIFQYLMLLALIAIVFYYGVMSVQLYIKTHYKLYELFYVPFFIVFIIVPVSMVVWMFHTILRIAKVFIKQDDMDMELWT